MHTYYVKREELRVKFWPAITSLDWYWYLAAAIVVAIRPMYRFFVR